MSESEAINVQITHITDYDRRSLYYTSLIQPHGVLLVLSEPELQILQVSNNSEAYLGIRPQNLLGQPLSILLDRPQIAALQQCLLEDEGSLSAIKLSVKGRQVFDGMFHRTEGGVVLELEPSAYPVAESFLMVQGLVKRAIAKLRQIPDLANFLHLLVTEIRKITGFDRVLVYKFDQQGAGSVIAEAKQEDLPSYLGLHYPATDIPELAREWYARSATRFVPDLTAPAVQLIPLENPISQQPLDLSLTGLRGVDPCCIEYHQNMGVRAFLVVSLIKDQQLWGLISCHHTTPKYLPHELRVACELVGQFAEAELANKVNQEELDYIIKLKALQSDFVASISQINNLKAALIHPEPRLLKLVNAQGSAVCLDDEISLVGETPTVEQVRLLLQWADTQVVDSLFYTHTLPTLYLEAEAFKNVASGLLVLRISKLRRYYVLWFRPEVIQTVNWAGDPSETIKVGVDGSVTLCPRTSFHQWQETVRLTSLKWKACELENALDLRNAIVGIVLNKADELAQINQELERSNRELDFFAYAASHDLKEPLRGIHNFSTLLLKGYADMLDEVGKSRLNTLIRLTRRMESLIDVLLKFSRLGQTELRLQSTDINTLLPRVIELLRTSRQDECIQPEIRIPRPLPNIECDPVLIEELFTNILSNAFKYNDKPEPWIEVGYLNQEEQLAQGLVQPNRQDSVTPVFYVQDNGIGIRERHLSTIFRLFKRLHEQNMYGGGTGAGLTIAQKIIERHGGQIWAKSTYGQGSTFYFTLKKFNILK